MTLAELERWPLERGWGAIRKAELAQHLTKYVVLPASRELCVKWAEVSWEARRQGRPIQTADPWIAVSALYYQVPLITNNPSDYESSAGSNYSRPRISPLLLKKDRPGGLSYDGSVWKPPSGPNFCHRLLAHRAFTGV